MSLVDSVAVFTTTLESENFTIPEGARTIDLYNSGDNDAFFIGDSSKGGKVSSSVTLVSGQAYSFGNLGKPYPAIRIDSSGTTVEITANY
jgi:hypothetical protein